MTAHEQNRFESLAETLGERYSCRGFLPEEIPEETVRKIVDAAQTAPSWCNAQPWQLSIVAGDAAKRFSEILLEAARASEDSPDFSFPQSYDGVYKDRRRACGFQLYDAMGIAKDDMEARTRQSMENLTFFGAPQVAIVSSDAGLGIYGAIDCGGFVTTFMVAARALGIASIAQASVAAYGPHVRKFLGLPDSRRVVCAISFGIEDKSHPANGFRTERASPEDVIEWKR